MNSDVKNMINILELDFANKSELQERKELIEDIIKNINDEDKINVYKEVLNYIDNRFRVIEYFEKETKEEKFERLKRELNRQKNIRNNIDKKYNNLTIKEMDQYENEIFDIDLSIDFLEEEIEELKEKIEGD